nr:hypothetical protein [Mycolicibacterium komanii]CRL73035.1 hypothetical protein CPGR_03088 [Mycolicibacterium komanii]
MIKTRIAAAAAIFTFALAALFATFAAATASADAGAASSNGGTVMTDTAEESVKHARHELDAQLAAARDGNGVNVPKPGSVGDQPHTAFPGTPLAPYTGKPDHNDGDDPAADPRAPMSMETSSSTVKPDH